MRASSRSACCTCASTLRAQGVQPLAGGGERQRLAAAIHQRAAVVAFQGFQLVRQRRLGKIQPAGGSRDIAAFGQRQQVRRWRSSSREVAMAFSMNSVH